MSTWHIKTMMFPARAWPTWLASKLFLLIALALPAVGQESQNCLFVGQIVRVSDPDHVVLTRKKTGKKDKAVVYAPLYPEDSIEVIFDGGYVDIRDQPRDNRHRIGPRNGVVKIPAVKCAVGEKSWAVFANFLPALSAVISSPIPTEPVITGPRPRGDNDAPVRLQPLGMPAVEQFVTLDLASLAIVWQGPPAEVRLVDSDNSTVIARAESTPYTYAKLLIRRSQGGRNLVLHVSSEKEQITRTLRVVDPDAQPRPPGLEALGDLSPAERAVYATWLVLDGPCEWRLQAISLLKAAADSDYMAWRLWRSVAAGELPSSCSHNNVP